MAWNQIHFAVSSDLAEPLSDALLHHGALTVSIENFDFPGQPEFEVFGEPGYETSELWPWCTLKVLIDISNNAQTIMQAACDELALSETPAFQVDTIEDQDWVQLTQSQFEPIQINDRLWIVPTWHTPPDERAINIRIDPGQAFGTGGHPTTQLCLNALLKELTPQSEVLDYGCGSGILAIAAAKVGVKSVVGVDIDDAAVSAAIHNAGLNNVSAHFYNNQDWKSIQQFDVVVANILAAPLKVLAPLLSSYVKPGGLLIMSGLLAKQTEEMINCYSPWLKLTQLSQQEEWVCLMGKK
ncbi:MAG: ribosomal protein L11 methyltransferase [Ferrovum sp. 37-45-19]|jgi:ribosomal protein L11 methyltransferase|uniref:50S ribosomal protein L11 methyltransferase n=1 Tax=Ferrovum sp. JA12 TaxID=1356299 RepID=UPI000703809C|nr:50S ribosomal protein L11 methyltransferase [Ferrovum sp. JA12]OYV79535.1 MAG: ribosomal protein L11 methyltransferase [Ferrovum sp. 21-44-67]OYV94671.1 MAG: ribosomal protein L11 methyltransferase [Ferrovum sp. 37-45-19]OZB34510.1 MAG: 50S ribosomal protein L11 methyltransferase [Ferrovum sp. 34-44-207]HQT81452.1 50S ribosomal protein L11 methyltransferase [Ferrovaceae bacterium]KRH79421.1 ribosomal protein L11 methyltransferase [Ferrovum sp. JA12]